MKPKIERRNKMKKNKGFTLIELLAVIVILAIIALIAVPVVMNIINSANKSAFKDSAYGILKAGELFYTDQLLENAGNATETTFTFPNDIEGLEFKGSKPSKGSMTVNKDGKVAMAITNGKYCVTKGFEDDDVTIKEDDGKCKNPAIVTLSDLATTGTFNFTYGSSPIEVNEVDECATSGICESGTAFAIKVNKTETYKFYVLNDDGKEVTLIMDRNLYSAEDLENETHYVPWISLDDYVAAGGTSEEYGSNGKTNKGPLTALKVLKERTANWTNIPAYSYTLENDVDSRNNQGVLGNNTYPNITGEVVTNVRARLPKRSEMLDIPMPDDFLYDNSASYWTSSIKLSDDVNAWYAYYELYTEFCSSSYDNGLRPVITLSK